MLKLFAAVLVLVAAAAVYIVGQRSCPPPDWAFWGNGNYGCVAHD